MTMPPAPEYIYGINPAFELLGAGRRRIYRAFFAENLRGPARTRKLIALYQAQGCPVEFAAKGRLFELCRTTEHQGVVIEADGFPYDPFQQLLPSGKLLLLDNLEDPQNVGAILRSAEVFGWRQVLLSSRGTAGIYPSVVKASAGATEYLRIARDQAANQYAQAALKNDFTLVALDRHGPTPLDDPRLASVAKMMLVIGGEHKAVGQFILNTAAFVVKIPLRGRISSLNASVAAGIALYRLGNNIGLPAGGF